MFETLRDSIQPITNMVARPFTIFHPSVLSFMSFLVAAPGFYFFAQGNSLLGCLFIFGALFDGIDGTVAKLTGKTSKFGGILDATLDRVFDGLVLMFMGIGGLVEWWLLFLVYITSVTISYSKAKAEASVGQSKVGKNQFSVGIAQRGDRLAMIFFGSILNHFFTVEDNLILDVTMWLLLLTAVITIIWRGIIIYKSVD